MSKMTQRRMNRRASRKVNQLRRENRRQNTTINALTTNLDSAFKALRGQRDTIRQLKEGRPAASTETL